MTDKPYVPSTADIRQEYTLFADDWILAGAAFDRWLEQVRAEAKAEGYDQALELLESQSEISLDDLEHYKQISPYRSSHE